MTALLALFAAVTLTQAAAPQPPVPQPPAGRTTIGVYSGWGAFRDASPARCFAIARPIAAGGRSTGDTNIASFPARGLIHVLHVRLSRDRTPAAPVTLTVGDRRFALVGNAREAWAADRASDRAITAALRSGRSMSIEAVGADGRPFADVYALAGAATAIDAATLACARR